jgi:U32 family peptidase
MDKTTKIDHKPLILAPAGNKAAFLAALAGKADAIYCGLKKLSARMAAINFSLPELISLAALARKNGTKLYITFNTLLKSEEMNDAGHLLVQLKKYVKPDALIVQDLAFLPLVRQSGFSGEIHLSTLANVSFSNALRFIKENLNVHQVVIPRELNIDEIKQLADACPENLGLEMFIHGALCYGVSGRCYWSSYMGGKSGLRGRCVQPCRRIYKQGQEEEKFFSCQDLSLDVLAKVLLDVPQIRAWKIEGRKKGPHYVYYTVTAYRLMRDHGRDPKAKKDALQLLERALGRPGTHYSFLPQRPQNPIKTDGHTSSGLLIGRVRGTDRNSYLAPREALYSGDILRIGYEDEPWHATVKIKKSIPKHGKYNLNPARKKGPKKGVPIFLVDRLEPALKEKLDVLSKELPAVSNESMPSSTFRAKLPKGAAQKSDIVKIDVIRVPGKRKDGNVDGYWLPLNAKVSLPKGNAKNSFWWLPPVIWPTDEASWISQIEKVIKSGARRFVLNAPWQIALFKQPKKCRLWAGPFCNVANPLAISSLMELGFHGVIVSPELGEKEMMTLPQHSPLPLGVVLSGHFPLCISRNLSNEMLPNSPFKSPKGEEAWAAANDSDYWVFPNWQLDLTTKQRQLERAGYRFFVSLKESVPKSVQLKKRPGVWNWDVGLP